MTPYSINYLYSSLYLNIFQCSQNYTPPVRILVWFLPVQYLHVKTSSLILPWFKDCYQKIEISNLILYTTCMKCITLERVKSLCFILITNKAVRKHASYYTALIMVEYLRWFVLPFSAYPCHYRPPPRGTWGVPTSASVARVTSTRSMTSAGSSMVRWWRKSTTRCYAGNPTGARSAIIFCTDKIITHFPTGF